MRTWIGRIPQCGSAGAIVKTTLNDGGLVEASLERKVPASSWPAREYLSPVVVIHCRVEALVNPVRQHLKAADNDRQMHIRGASDVHCRAPVAYG